MVKTVQMLKKQLQQKETKTMTLSNDIRKRILKLLKKMDMPNQLAFMFLNKIANCAAYTDERGAVYILSPGDYMLCVDFRECKMGFADAPNYSNWTYWQY